jgi:hypothetical protein
MKVGLALICGILFVVFPALGQSKDAQDKSADRVQIVSTAEITKIDAKKKMLQVRELVAATDTGQRTERRSGGGGYPGGGRRGGGGRRPGNIGFPGGGGGGYPGRTGGTSTNHPKEYKVFVTKDTKMMLANSNIEFSDLRVGDRIDISGTPKGTKGDLEATSISRNLK